MTTAPSTSQIRVAVSRDGLTVELIVPDGAVATVHGCAALLAGAGLRPDEQTQAAIERVLASQPINGERRGVVLTGQPAIAGQDAHVQWQPECRPDDQPESPVDAPPAMSPGGTHRVVRAGQLLGRIVPPAPGTDGRDVRGQMLPAAHGRAISFNVDQSITLDDQGALIAARDGVLSHSACRASVRALEEFAGDVDDSTGDIDHDGDVLITGSVAAQRTIRATGSVEVHGLIGAAAISCGDDLLALGGIAGSETGFAAVGGRCVARYLDGITLHVRGDLVLEREMINCRAVVHGGVVAPAGSIIGGSLSVTGHLSVAALGSEAGTTTIVHLGSVPLIEPRLQQLTVYAGQLQEHHAALADELRLLEMPGRRLSTQEKERLTEATFERSSIQERLARCELARERLEGALASVRTVNATIHRVLNAGVELVVANQSFRVSRAVKGPIRVLRDRSGELVYLRPDTGAGARLSQIAEVRAAA